MMIFYYVCLINVCFVAGFQFGASKWLLPDTRSIVQTDWIDSEFLHSTRRYDTNLYADRSTLGCKEAKSTNGLHAQYESK